jgi:hypothetical protein
MEASTKNLVYEMISKIVFQYTEIFMKYDPYKSLMGTEINTMIFEMEDSSYSGR